MIELPTIKVVGDRLYQLVEDFDVEWMHDGDRHLLRIHAGFVCDGNSVPWFGRPLIPGDWTLGLVPVLAHDFLYYRKGLLLPYEHVIVTNGVMRDATEAFDGSRLRWSRKDADRLFGHLMRKNGVPRWRRRLAYRAVRLAAWKNWPDD